MARHYITDQDGNEVRNSSGERQFWSDSDGDRPTDQTVYGKERGFDGQLGGCHKEDARYDPSTSEFKE